MNYDQQLSNHLIVQRLSQNNQQGVQHKENTSNKGSIKNKQSKRETNEYINSKKHRF